MQQRDVARFIVKTHVDDTCSIATVGGQFAINRYQARDVLNTAGLFLKLKGVFDQCRINAIKVRIVPTAMVSVDDATLASCIAWDRNGTVVGDMNFGNLCSYGSAKINYYSPGSKTVQSHWIAAESLQEKASWISTQSLAVQNSALFDPHFLIGIQGPGQLGQEQMYMLGYTMEWTFDVTFRGTRLQ